MTTQVVRGCQECPLFRSGLDSCMHPDNEGGQRFLDYELVAAGSAPGWCKLVDEPLLVQRK